MTAVDPSLTACMRLTVERILVCCFMVWEGVNE
jgi:hypothetical protein